MNRNFFFTILASVAFSIMFTGFTACAAFWGNDSDPWEKRLPFKSAVIEYKISGMQNGTKTTYIKDYGRYKASYKNMSMNILGMVKNMETIEITTPDWIYDIDMAEKSGTKSVNALKYMHEEYKKLSGSDQKKLRDNVEKMGLDVMNGMHGKVRKKAAKFLGRSCDIITMQGMTIYVLAGTSLPLKTESNIMGMHSVEEATKITETRVPEDRFEPPAGVQIRYDKESDARAREMASRIIHGFVDGKPVNIPVKGHARQPHQGFPVMGTPGQHGASAGTGDNDVPPDMNEFMKRLKGMMKQAPHGE